MAYIIHRISKHHSFNKIKAHIERGEHYEGKSTLSAIDASKTHQNAFLEPCQNLTDGEVREKYRARKNAVLAIEGLYTASPEFFKDKPKWAVKAFFDECLDFHKRHYGQVFSAVVHYDESTPHLHVLSIPEKDGKLNAKSFVGGPKDCARIQNEIAEEVGSEWGLERGKENSERVHTNAVRHQKTVLDAKERELNKLIDVTTEKMDEVDRKLAEDERLFALINAEHDRLKAEKEEVKRMTVKRAREVLRELELDER